MLSGSPTLEYCSSVWDPYTSELTNQIELVQRRAARLVKNDYSRQSSVISMLNSLNWEPLPHRRKIARMPTFHKAYEGYLAVPVQNLLHPVQRSTRRSHSKAFIEIRPNKDCFKFSFLPKTLIDWNGLPHHIIDIQDPKIFKRELTAHFQ